MQAAFPQLEVMELIGAGGMGIVYKARQPHLDRLVALKILPRRTGPGFPMKPSASSPSSEPSRFQPTRWTLVLRAGGNSREADAALAELCQLYYTPVIRFLAREGRNEDDARELTHEFFARWIAKHPRNHVDPNRGRFRSYLLGAVKHFLADWRDRQYTTKLGGPNKPAPLDQYSETGSPVKMASS